MGRQAHRLCFAPMSHRRADSAEPSRVLRTKCATLQACARPTFAAAAADRAPARRGRRGCGGGCAQRRRCGSGGAAAAAAQGEDAKPEGLVGASGMEGAAAAERRRCAAEAAAKVEAEAKASAGCGGGEGGGGGGGGRQQLGGEGGGRWRPREGGGGGNNLRSHQAASSPLALSNAVVHQMGGDSTLVGNHTNTSATSPRSSNRKTRGGGNSAGI